MPNNRDQMPLPLYRREDYVGAFRHLVIFAIDGLVVYLIGCGFAVISVLAQEFESTTISWSLFVLFLIVVWCYLAVLKPSRFRSPGYWIADAKIITIRGDAPSPWRMTLRLFWMFFWLIGWPWNFILDLSWSQVDRSRQMLRDVIAETRLIRNRAQPIGVGRLSYTVVMGLGVVIFYPEVLERRGVSSEKAIT